MIITDEEKNNENANEQIENLITLESFTGQNGHYQGRSQVCIGGGLAEAI